MLGAAYSLLVTKHALLSQRLPEPLSPEDDIAEFGLAEDESAAFRAHPPKLKEWTQYPEEGSPDSVDLLNCIRAYVVGADSIDARCGLKG